MNNSDFRKVKSVVNSTVYGGRGHGDFHRSLGGRSTVSEDTGYNGYFKINFITEDIEVETEEGTEINTIYKIQIYDGIYDEYELATYAGAAIINDTLYWVDKVEFELESSSFIYLQSTMTDGVISTPEILLGTNFPLPVENTYKELIGRVAMVSNEFKTPIQEHYGVIRGYIFEECV